MAFSRTKMDAIFAKAMMYLDAWEIMSRHSLIPRKLSKQILKSISQGVAPAADVLPAHVSLDEVDNIQRRYQEKLEQIGGKVARDQPRNLPFYLIIQDLVPGFSWTVNKRSDDQKMSDVNFNCPYVERVRPSLLSLLLNLVGSAASTDLHRKYDAAYRLPESAAQQIDTLFENANLVRPSDEEFDRVVHWIEKGLSGEPLTVVSPICPDYEARHLGGNVYRYSFSSLGSGVGVVAQRLLAALPVASKVFSSIGLNVRFIVAIGDFEAFSPTTCERVGLTEREFIDRLRMSQSAFMAACKVDVETPLFTDLVGGKQAWTQIKDEILRRVKAGDTGQTGLSRDDLHLIANSRRGLYKRWYEIDDEDAFLEILINQGAEYCAMGQIVADGVENGLVLGADHSRMAPFFSFHQSLPVLYLRNNYLGVR